MIIHVRRGCPSDKSEYEGDEGILLHRYGKLTIEQLESLRLSRIVVVRLPFMFFFISKISKHETGINL